MFGLEQADGNPLAAKDAHDLPRQAYHRAHQLPVDEVVEVGGDPIEARPICVLQEVALLASVVLIGSRNPAVGRRPTTVIFLCQLNPLGSRTL